MPREPSDDRIPLLSVAEEAELQVRIAADPDAAEPTDAEMTGMRPASEVLPAALYAALTRSRGPQKAPTKALVSLRLDRDVLEHFRASGPGWQTRVNDLLRAAMK